ncbi:universal stress protein [Nocardioides sp. LMS-CY]|uniref:Nucleotide-binding universal stress UspA family protein n=1 Tax=Nocardioides soli TaxID=1036020 RepID=A0A7W4W1I4_9ACTN|nr:MULTISPECIES: universal stress protein [Nocardioides]MBB3045239.1 nucleotide-binding universal stress UspA family protein [Nocardioides soli]QWF21864.1 universal stress protein [Nocardioides sp. LMS-CY]
MAAERTVIVGHDGSSTSDLALAWALDYAGSVGADVRVIRGWSISTAPRPASMSGGYIPPIEEFEAAVVAELERDGARVVAERGVDVDVTFEGYRGAPANGLVEASRDADLLVVGARGLGGFRGLALGSVSDQCVRHAACPVVVIRDEHSADIERSRQLDGGLGA